MNNSLIPKIQLLASYPKSGNTWVRAFIHVYKNKGQELSDLNELSKSKNYNILSSRRLLDDTLGIHTSDLSNEEIQKLRYRAYEYWNESLGQYYTIKTHDKPFHFSTPVIPHHSIEHVVLIVRNPFDIALSYANHEGVSTQEAINRINNSENCFAKAESSLNNQVEQHLGKWSEFNLEWIQKFKNKITIVRYEDLLENPSRSFEKTVTALNLKVNTENLLTAIKATSFDKLQEMEDQYGFNEKNKRSNQFFLNGRSGVWKNQLSTSQVNQILKHQRDGLLEFGYIDQHNNILI